MFKNSRKKIIIKKDNNFLKIEIPKGYRFRTFNNEVKKLNVSECIIGKIIGSVLKYDSDIINENKKIPSLEIYFINESNISYEIIKQDKDNVLISQIVTNNELKETSLEVRNNSYLISTLIHNLNGSTKSIETYSSFSEETLVKTSKEKNFRHAKKLLDKLSSSNAISNIINVNDLYKKLNIISKDKYNPVISDDIISLCSTKKEKNINDERFCLFNIILNSTYEVVGGIDFNYQVSGPSELGNVMYNIKEAYRNNHYCTRALTLLKKLLKDNTFDGDKNLYIASINEYSAKVAISNGGILCEIPYKDSDENYEEDLFGDGVIKEEQEIIPVFKINI